MSYPENTAEVLLAAYPDADALTDYEVHSDGASPPTVTLPVWNESKLGPQPTEIQVYEWATDAALLPSGYIFTAALVSGDVYRDTEALYAAGMPYTHPTDGEAYVSLRNAEWVSQRVDANDVQQGRISGSQSPPYFYFDVHLNAYRLNTDEEHESFWLALNNHTTAIFGSHSILMERLRALGVSQTQQAFEVRTDSVARTPEGIGEQFLRALSLEDARIYAANQVEQVNNRVESSTVKANGHHIRANEVKALQNYVTSEENDWPYYIQVMHAEPLRVNSAQQAKQIIKRLGEKRRRAHGDGRELVVRIQNAANHDQLVDLIEENRARSV